MKPYLSVLIPCRNEERFLARCLDSVLATDYPKDRMEILVIDGASSDGTREVIASYTALDARVRLIENRQKITPVALNLGIEASRGEVIARVDAHSTVSSDYFTRCADALDALGADCAGGIMRTLPRDRSVWAEAIVAALSHRFGVGNSHFRTGAEEPLWVDTVFGACWKRTTFERVGLFNVDLERSQDMEFSLRLQAAEGKTVLLPHASTDYYARSTFRQFCRHNFINGEWAILPFLYSPLMPVAPRHLVPLAFVTGLVLGLTLLPLTPLVFLAVAGPYLALNLGVSCRIFQSRPKLRLALLPLTFFALHAAYGLGSAWGSLRGILILLSRPFQSKEPSCLPHP